MNAIAERWLEGCRGGPLDRTRIWNQAHPRQILNHYETHHDQHRPQFPARRGTVETAAEQVDLE